jgi:ubiquinol-cytochrome c reductase iron-sulfur subunit
VRHEEHGEGSVHEAEGPVEQAPAEAEGRMLLEGAPPQATPHLLGTEAAIALGFSVAILAGLGLAVCYLLGGQVQIEGVLLFFTLGGIGFGIAGWGKYLMPNGPFVQDREPLTSTMVEREGFAASFERGAEEIGRRRFLRRLLGGAVTALGVALLFPIRSLGPNPGTSLSRTAWFPGSRLIDENGNAVRPSDLAVGGLLTVFPEGAVGDATAQTVLVHAAEQPVVTHPGREDWSPQGFLAFSKVCTHAGCPVGLYEHRTNQLLCPCHQSLFNVLQGCRVAFGPAPRALPQLPLDLQDGYLVARRDYLEPIGPSFWNRS